MAKISESKFPSVVPPLVLFANIIIGRTTGGFQFLKFQIFLASFMNDAIQISKEEKKGEKTDFWRYLKKNLPHEKRGYPSYPAVKIGRLGVLKKYQRSDIGTSLINMTKDMFLTDNRTGCRFLTVDAVNKDPVLNFYKKNSFDFLWKKDEEKTTRIMFFDLKRHNESG